MASVNSTGLEHSFAQHFLVGGLYVVPDLIRSSNLVPQNGAITSSHIGNTTFGKDMILGTAGISPTPADTKFILGDGRINSDTLLPVTNLPGSGFTFEFFLEQKVDSTNTHILHVNAPGISGTRFGLFISVDGKLWFDVGGTASNTGIVFSNGVVEHLAIRATNNGSLTTFELLRNGVVVFTPPDTNHRIGYDKVDITFGRFGSTDAFNGYINGPRIWSRSLSDTELTDISNASKTQKVLDSTIRAITKPVDPDRLLNQWKLDNAPQLTTGPNTSTESALQLQPFDGARYKSLPTGFKEDKFSGAVVFGADSGVDHGLNGYLENTDFTLSPENIFPTGTEDNFSLEFFCYLSDIQNNSNIVTLSDPINGSKIEFFKSSSGSFRIKARNTATPTSLNEEGSGSGFASFPLNQLVHVGIQVQHSSLKNQTFIRLYINHTLIDQFGIDSMVEPGEAQLRFGNDGTRTSFSGWIADARIWRRIISSAETKHYDNTLLQIGTNDSDFFRTTGSICVGDNELKGRWRFNRIKTLGGLGSFPTNFVNELTSPFDGEFIFSNTPIGPLGNIDLDPIPTESWKRPSTNIYGYDEALHFVNKQIGTAPSGVTASLDNITFSGSKECTIEFLVYLDSPLQSDEALFSNSTVNGTGKNKWGGAWVLHGNSDNGLDFTTKRYGKTYGSDPYTRTISSKPLPIKTLFHLALVLTERSSGQSYYNAYVNGDIINDIPFNLSHGDFSGGSNAFISLGKKGFSTNYDGYTGFYVENPYGYIDSLKIWNRALNTTELRNLSEVLSEEAELCDIDLVPPGIVHLVATATGEHTINLSWEETADDGFTGSPVKSYDIRISSGGTINEGNFETMPSIEDGPSPAVIPAPISPGNQLNVVVGSLDRESSYIFAIKAVDRAGNKSALDLVYPNTSVAGATTLDTTPPAPVVDMFARGISTSEIELTWTDVGDDGNVGTATSYEISFSQTPIFDVNSFESGSRFTVPPAGSAGTPHTYTKTSLAAGTHYWFAVRAKDNKGNIGQLVNNSTSFGNAWTFPTAQPCIDRSGIENRWELNGSPVADIGTETFVLENNAGFDPWLGPQPFNNALSFGDGVVGNSLSRAIVPAGGGLQILPGNQFTVDFHLHVTDDISNSGILAFRDQSTGIDTLSMSFTNSGFTNFAGSPVRKYLKLKYLNQTNSIIQGTSLGLINTHHIALVGNGTELRLYVDGDLETIVTASTPYTGNSALSLVLGSANGVGSSFDGQIDGLNIWSRALNEAEVSQLSDVLIEADAICPPDLTPPSVIDLNATATSASTIDLDWLAVGNDGLVGIADRYEIKIDIVPIINETQFNAATSIESLPFNVTLPVPAASGTPELLTVPSLDSNTTYYFGIRAFDDQNNAGPITPLSFANATTFDALAPAAINDLVATANTAGDPTDEIKLEWTSTGDDGFLGTADAYEIRFSLFPITFTNYDTALSVETSGTSVIPAPLIAGTAQSMIVNGLDPDTTYYFAIKAIDSDLNISPLDPSGGSVDNATTDPEPIPAPTGRTKCVHLHFDTRQIVFKDDTILPEDDFISILNNIDGFEWDDTFWDDLSLRNPDAHIPALWDPSKKNIEKNQWQSGIRFKDDLLVKDIFLEKEGDRNQWRTKVHHGQYYERDQLFYLHSDSSRVKYIGQWSYQLRDHTVFTGTRGVFRYGFNFDPADFTNDFTVDFLTDYHLKIDLLNNKLELRVGAVLLREVFYLFDSRPRSITIDVGLDEISISLDSNKVLCVLDDTESSGSFSGPVELTSVTLFERVAPSSLMYMNLEGIPKEGISISANRFERLQDDEAGVLVDLDIKKKTEFTGIVREGLHLPTLDANDNIIEEHMDLLRDEFIVNYDSTPVSLRFNKNFLKEIGSLDVPLHETLQLADHPICINELLGRGRPDVDILTFNINVFPILDDDRSTLKVFVLDADTLQLDTDWVEVEDISFYDFEDKVYQVDRDLGIIRFGYKAPPTRIHTHGNFVPKNSNELPVHSTAGYPNSGTLFLTDGEDVEEFKYGHKTDFSFIGSSLTTKAWDNGTEVYDLNSDFRIHGSIPSFDKLIYLAYTTTVKVEYEPEGTLDDIIPQDLDLNPITHVNSRSIVHLSRRLTPLNSLILSTDEPRVNPDAVESEPLHGPVGIGGDFANLQVLAQGTGEDGLTPASNIPITFHVIEDDTGTIAGVGKELSVISNKFGIANTVYLPPSNVNNLGQYYDDTSGVFQNETTNEISFPVPDGLDLTEANLNGIYLYQILKDDPHSGRAHKNIRLEVDEPLEFEVDPNNPNVYIARVKKGFHKSLTTEQAIGDIVTDVDTLNPFAENGLTPDVKDSSGLTSGGGAPLFFNRVTNKPAAGGEYRFRMSEYPDNTGSNRFNQDGVTFNDYEEQLDPLDGTGIDKDVGVVEVFYNGPGDNTQDALDMAAANINLSYYWYDFEGDDIDFFINADTNNGNGRKVVLHKVLTDGTVNHPVLVDENGDPLPAGDTSWNDSGIPLPVNVPVRPDRITETQIIYKVDATEDIFPLPNTRNNTDFKDLTLTGTLLRASENAGILGGYWIVTNRTVTVYASAFDEVTKTTVYSNRLKFNISLPTYLLGDFVQIWPFGFKIIGGTPIGEQFPDPEIVTAATGLDGATYLSINPVAGPHPLFLDGVKLNALDAETQSPNSISHQITVS